MSKDALKDLQDRLVGKRIVAVEPAQASEGLCLFKTDDGQSFRLHATDLGFWTEDTVGEDGHYPSLHALMVEYCYHNHDIAPDYGFNPPDAKVKFKDGVQGPNGRKETVTFRCELEDDHHGPHLYTVPKGFNNTGEKLWWG